MRSITFINGSGEGCGIRQASLRRKKRLRETLTRWAANSKSVPYETEQNALIGQAPICSEVTRQRDRRLMQRHAIFHV